MKAEINVLDHFHDNQGFCHPDWDAIGDVLEKAYPETEWNTAWEEVARMWTERLRSQLGGAYQVYETENFLILSEASKRVIGSAGKSFEEALKKILKTLPTVASDSGLGKHVVLMFSSLDDYYGYITYFYPEGDHPMSGGVCLSGDGYIHFALSTIDYSSYQTVLVHELTHGCVSHLPIPTWLDEALAMRMEEVVCHSNVFELDREIFQQHLEHWNAETIQQFWSGESWGIPDAGFDLSYNLAQVIWRKIEGDLKVPLNKILEFISNAHFEDAGEKSSQEVFGMSLGDLVEDFLGEGKWAPQPRAPKVI